jgi:hypothetical protein
MKTFDYDFKNSAGEIDFRGINGYMEALYEVYKHIAGATECNSDNRFIDAVALLDKIVATNKELMLLFREAEENLIKQADEILNEKPIHEILNY